MPARIATFRAGGMAIPQRFVLEDFKSVRILLLYRGRLGLGLGFITTECTGYATTRLSDDSRRTLNSLRSRPSAGPRGNRWQTRRLNSLNTTF